jgi:hypothetical protein
MISSESVGQIKSWGGTYLIPSSVLWLLVIACFAGCADKAGTVKGKRSWRSGSGVQS